MKINRYPGVKPFQRDEQALFFGRAREIRELCDLVRVEKIVVLFGKSGYGKSSLLNAGVLPQLAANMQAIEVRFGEYIPGQSPTPLDAVRRRLDDKVAPDAGMDFLDAVEGPDSLWRAFKKRGARPMLLVFDQFEEFFSYPAEQQQAFKRELAELLDADLPDTLRESARSLSRDQRRLLAAPPNVHALFAIRSDRMSELDRLKDQLPAILSKRYEIRALTREQAREAIVGPAQLLVGAPLFTSSPFEYQPEAIEHILNDLTGSHVSAQAGVEAFQLQILCDSIEGKVAAGLIADRDGDGLADVTTEDLPDFNTVYGEYYERRLSTLDPAQQSVARRVIEDGLVRYDLSSGEGRRMSVDGDALLQQFRKEGLTEELLRELEDTFLLRREPNTVGGYNYEISHDTLLGPITEAARERHEAEETKRLRLEAEEAQRRETEALAREREANRRRHRATLLAWGAGLAAALAIMASVFAYYKAKDAERAEITAKEQAEIAQSKKQEAEKQEELARVSAEKAIEQTHQAEEARLQAYHNLELAKKQEALAKERLDQLEKQQNATEEARRTAQQNFEDAKTQKRIAEENEEKARLALQLVEEKTAEIVKTLLNDASNDIHALRYQQAVNRLHDAIRLVEDKQNDSPLGRMKTMVADSLFEPAYFFIETNKFIFAHTEISKIIKLRGSSASQVPLGRTREELQKLLKQQNSARYAALETRYYPVLIRVAGGAYDMIDISKNEKNRHEQNASIEKNTRYDSHYRVVLSDYYISNTEITYFQWMLYDQKITNYAPQWGIDGNAPVVLVSWYDACLYANWLSERKGLKPAYKFVKIKSGINSKLREQDSIPNMAAINVYKKNISDEKTEFDSFVLQLDLTANGFRLPTEAEWEYAAAFRPVAGAPWTKYSGSDTLDLVGWYDKNAKIRGIAKPHAVAQKQPNGLGVYDMCGNVKEWCWDIHADYPTGQSDYLNPTGNETGDYRIVRGGSFEDGEGSAHISHRHYVYPDRKLDNIGFRLCRSH